MGTVAGLESTAQIWKDIFDFELQIHLPKGGTRKTHKFKKKKKEATHTFCGSCDLWTAALGK